MKIHHSGFTLIEIVIALFIFSVISTITVTGLQQVIKSRHIVQDQIKQLSELQIAITVLERDIEQFIPRDIVNAEGVSEEAFIEDDVGGHRRLELTRTGYSNPLAQQNRSTLQRIA